MFASRNWIEVELDFSSFWFSCETEDDQLIVDVDILDRLEVWVLVCSMRYDLWIWQKQKLERDIPECGERLDSHTYIERRKTHER